MKRYFSPFLVILFMMVMSSVPAVAVEGYMDGSFSGLLTFDTDNAGSFILPGGAIFPQVTVSDVTFDNPETVDVLPNISIEFIISTGEVNPMPIEGTARLIKYNAGSGDDYCEFYMGNFDITLEDDADPPAQYTVSGAVIGDQYTFYMAGKDDANTPGDTTDDNLFLFRLNPIAPIDTGSGYLVTGMARIMISDSLKTTIQDNIDSDIVQVPDTSGFDGDGLPSTATSYFNQITPPDGTENFLLDGVPGNAADYAAGLGHAGRLAGTGPAPLAGDLDFTQSATVLTSGDDRGKGLSYGRFTFRPDSGGYIEGFMVGDLVEGVINEENADGFIFSIATSGGVRGLLFGSYDGIFSSSWTDFSGSVDAEIYAMDVIPPEALRPEDDDELYTSEFREHLTISRDLNGWNDQKAVYMLINDSRRKERIMGKYLVRKNKLYLYNKRLGTWVGGFRPGSTKLSGADRIIRTPWVRLNCTDTMVTRVGEYVIIQWQLKPSARMIGSWKAYLKVSDFSRQVTGWRLGTNDLQITESPSP